MSTYYVDVRQAGQRFGYAIRDGRGSTIAHSDTRFASATTAAGAGWAKAEHLVRMDKLLGRRSFIDGAKPEKAAVLRAVAKALAESQVQDAQLVEKILAQIDKVFEQRRAARRGLPAITVSDASAPARQDDEPPTQHAAISR